MSSGQTQIQRMFDSIAPGYDAFNHLTSLGADRRWRRAALREIVGTRILDEACGTGDFAIAIAKDNPRRSVVGVDISEGMLEVMRRKVAAEGLAAGSESAGLAVGSERVEVPAGITAETGDCCALPYTEAAFDTVTVAFGMRNFENREKALAEVLRVLRPGGRFVMLELGIPRGRIVRAAYVFYFTRVMPLIGAGISGDRAAYRYLPASVMSFPAPDDWKATMLRAGFHGVRHRSLSLGICNLFVGEKA